MPHHSEMLRSTLGLSELNSDFCLDVLLTRFRFSDMRWLTALRTLKMMYSVGDD